MRQHKKALSLVESRRGRLLVTSEFLSNSCHGEAKVPVWFCLCDCDCGTKDHSVRKSNLTSENGTQSCGCVKKELLRKRMTKLTIPKEDAKLAISVMREQGLSYRKIGVKIGVTGQRVFQIHKNLNKTPPALSLQGN